ncbi:inositol monophosphatase family protein [Streptomyces sp. NPDC087218]|uniref:inositol monophosphatase family protein n=1 Tax=Streptomyces sp. NPDC087218 TaxID=3365769 RepID=UPI003822EF1B
MTLTDLLPIAHEAVDQATQLVTDMSVGTVTAKGDRDMVSGIDLAVEDKLRAFLLRETPHIGFLGEERGGAGANSALTWALDPVDGTANLVHGLPLCGIALGLIDGDRSVLGVINLPFLDERFHAAEGHGAYCGKTRLRASTTTDLAQAIVSIGDYAVGTDATSRNRPRLALTRLLAEKVQRVRMFGSAAIDLAWAAAGRVDATIAFSNHPWDMSAGVVIAREAGASVMDAAGEPHTIASAATVSAAPGIREDILQMLRMTEELL